MSPWLAVCRSRVSRWCWASGAGLLVERCGTATEHVLGPHRPSQKGVRQAPSGVAARVPSIDIGLRALGEGPPMLGEIIEKGGRETYLVAGLLDLHAGERAASSQGVQTALNVPGREELQESPVPGVADGRQFLGEPPLEQQQLPVSRGQNALCMSRSRR